MYNDGKKFAECSGESLRVSERNNISCHEITILINMLYALKVDVIIYLWTLVLRIENVSASWSF